MGQGQRLTLKVRVKCQGHRVKNVISGLTVLHVMINAMDKGQRWVKNSLKVMMAGGVMSSFRH